MLPKTRTKLLAPWPRRSDRRGLKVWYDDFTLTIGDSLRRSIDKGLARSRYGVVILSPYFFRKDWPQKELDGLTARERNGIKVILPVWHQVDKEFVLRYSPTLADRVAARMDKGIDQVVGEIVRAISIDRPTEDAQAEGSSSKENAKQLARRERCRGRCGFAGGRRERGEWPVLRGYEDHVLPRWNGGRGLRNGRL